MNSKALMLTVAALGLLATPRCDALVFCVTNAVDEHQAEPTGELADSGWRQTVPLAGYLATLIHSNALLTAKHLTEIAVGAQFAAEGVTHTLTSLHDDSVSDLRVFFFTPPVTNYARINIETNDIHAFVVLQGRGMERGDVVVAGGRTNGWKWAWNKWWSIRRWGVNQYVGESSNGIYALANFDNNGNPDECMTSGGDSGGPGFVRTGSGWKLATVNYAVGPSTFTLATNPVSSFNASLYDIAGLYYKQGAAWIYVPTNASPAPCLMANTRTSTRIAWLTNTVSGLVFPADVGVSWRCETNQPSGSQAAAGIGFAVIATNAGPYTARNVMIDLQWPVGLRIRGSSATHGSLAANRWTLPALEDGCTATLRVEAAVWRAAAGWGTNRVSITHSDKPDGVLSNNAAILEVFLPQTATRLMIR